MRLLPLSSFLCFLTISILAGCGGGIPPTISSGPKNQTVIAGQSVSFSVTATGAGKLGYQWYRNGEPISGASSPSYAIAATSAPDDGAFFTATVSNSSGSATSESALLTVYSTDVLTYHNDNARTGQYLAETTLTPSNVNEAHFGKLNFLYMDGRVDATPLYASKVMVPNKGVHNLLIAASENDSVYAFDADTGAIVWQVSMLKVGETPSNDPSGVVPFEIGVNATPVIDRGMRPNGAIYVVASSLLTQDGSETYYQRLHALDLALGTELFGGPVDVKATYPGTGDGSDGTNVVFDSEQYRERAGLLLLNHVIYTTWASHYDLRPYTGWIIGYNEFTLAQTTMLNITPNGNTGGIWMGGSAPASDASGNIYFLDGNGYFDTALDSKGFPIDGDYGNAFMKLSTTSGLAVKDYFEMDNGVVESDEDRDLGSGGAMVLPDQNDSSGNILHLAVGAGKDGNLYVVNRDSLGKFSKNNNNIYQELAGDLAQGIFGAPAYFNGAVYYGSVNGPLQKFTIKNAKLLSTAKTAHVFGYPGTTPSISANITSNAIVWGVESTGYWQVLHAYDATNLNEIYNSDQASGGRDQYGVRLSFMTPMIANGKVFVTTTNGVGVFGLLP
ncbi:MAG: pyrrolo-quinoline quinone [Candidatus Sulfotelmatobacter sp.]